MQHSKYDIAKLQFDLFCEKRGYEVMSFMTNYKNKEQFLGEYMDPESLESVTILISKNNKYYQLLGNKKYKEIEYVLKEEEKNE